MKSSEVRQRLISRETKKPLLQEKKKKKVFQTPLEITVVRDNTCQELR